MLTFRNHATQQLKRNIYKYIELGLLHENKILHNFFDFHFFFYVNQQLFKEYNRCKN